MNYPQSNCLQHGDGEIPGYPSPRYVFKSAHTIHVLDALERHHLVLSVDLLKVGPVWRSLNLSVSQHLLSLNLSFPDLEKPDPEFKDLSWDLYYGKGSFTTRPCPWLEFEIYKHTFTVSQLTAQVSKTIKNPRSNIPLLFIGAIFFIPKIYSNINIFIAPKDGNILGPITSVPTSSEEPVLHPCLPFRIFAPFDWLEPQLGAPIKCIEGVCPVSPSPQVFLQLSFIVVTYQNLRCFRRPLVHGVLFLY